MALSATVGWAALATGAAPTPPAAHAGPHSEIASAFDEGDKFDLFVTIDYLFDIRRAAVKREFSGFAGTGPNDPMPIVKDLFYSSSRHTILPRLELGVFRDLALAVAMPIVVSDTRNLEFDQRSTPCVFPGGTGAPTCIDSTNSTTVQDGLLPTTGFDANDPTGPGFTDPSDPTIFRGPRRAGLDQVHLGIIWAAMNQSRDDTKPSWKLGAEMRLPIGAAAKLDRADPDGETGVGTGLYEVKLWTTMAKRLTWAEPYVEVWWRAPVGQKSDSPFKRLEPEFGQIRTSAQQYAGTRFGFEAFAWEKAEEHQRVSVELAARLQASFEGRAYTEMWEIFQYAGDATSGGPLVLDSNPTATGTQAYSHPGVSNVENYLTFGGRVGVRADLGEKVSLGAFFELAHDQAHLISFADAGVDGDNDSNDVVDPGTAEVNPFHVRAIDMVGHRYMVDEATSYIVLVSARGLF